MKKYIGVLLIFLLLTSCDEKKKEYYGNGAIAKEYFLKNDKFEGNYKEYYETGGLKEFHKYRLGERIDTSRYYYGQPENTLRKIEYSDLGDFIKVIDYFQNGSKKREGKVLASRNRIGKWSLYSEDGILSEVLEYIDLGGEEYLNQGWHFDKKGDTIIGKGNYLQFKFSKDTVAIFEPVKILAFLKEPLLSFDSDVFICIPKGALDEVNVDFSNLPNVEWDTLPSVKNEKIVKDYEMYNLHVSFGLEFNKPGIKHVRGFLLESNEIEPNGKSKDSFDMKERKIYFDKEIYVSDSNQSKS
jgi:hypothetical protein